MNTRGIVRCWREVRNGALSDFSRTSEVDKIRIMDGLVPPCCRDEDRDLRGSRKYGKYSGERVRRLISSGIIAAGESATTVIAYLRCAPARENWNACIDKLIKWQGCVFVFCLGWKRHAENNKRLWTTLMLNDVTCFSWMIGVIIRNYIW